MITDDQVQEAFDFLHENAEKAAKARATRIYMEDYAKTVKANCMRKHEGKPVTVQEREAYADADYTAHLKLIRESVAQDEWYRWMRDSRITLLECWRTEQSNKRAEGKVG